MVRNREEIEIMIQPDDSDNYNVRLIISSTDRHDSIDISKIIKCISSKNIVLLTLANNRIIKVNIGIRLLSKLLKPYHFLRVHRTSLVNTNFIDKYILDENCLVMTDSSRIPVSKYKRKDLHQSIEMISNNFQF